MNIYVFEITGSVFKLLSYELLCGLFIKVRLGYIKSVGH